jgi:hypothetical protein
LGTYRAVGIKVGRGVDDEAEEVSLFSEEKELLFELF